MPDTWTNDSNAQGRLLFEMSVPGRRGANLPDLDVPAAELPPQEMLRESLTLPEVGEVEVVRYFTHLSHLNYSIESGMYPLGSCTMKYNPKVHEDIARLPGFAWTHPHQAEETVQGNLQVLCELQGFLAEITGMDAVGLSPMAGAHGELAGVLIIKAYHTGRGEAAQRRKVLVPDSAHGTNPATAAMAGYQVVAIRSDANGNTDLEHLRSQAGDDVAGMMLTQPNTLGLFDPNIVQIADLLHQHGALLYGDGANMNALVGQTRPGALGFDVMHLNLHKTFSTPHGGGGPGAGPVCVKAPLAPFLPFPIVVQRSVRPVSGGDSPGREALEEPALSPPKGRAEAAGGVEYHWAKPEQTIGRMGGWYGNFGVLLRAYAYIRTLGAEGCRAVSENAVLNANYLRVHLQKDFQLKYNRTCMHEVVLSGVRQKAKGVNTLAIAKRLIDYGFHPPTIYFPLIVEEALMIEPTETESKESLDAFIAAMKNIAREVVENPEIVTSAPHNTPVSKLDEAGAARNPRLRWKPALPKGVEAR